MRSQGENIHNMASWIIQLSVSDVEICMHGGSDMCTTLRMCALSKSHEKQYAI